MGDGGALCPPLTARYRSCMNHAEIQQRLAMAGQAQRAGRAAEAAQIYRVILDRAGEQPVALNALGMGAMAAGDTARAADFFRRAIAADPNAPELWMNLAKAHRLAHDDAAEEAALEGALAVDQRHFMALVRLAELLERIGANKRAADRWSGVLAMAQAIEEKSPALEIMFEHARTFVADQRAVFATAVDEALQRVREGLTTSQRRRFDAGVDHTMGRRQIYTNQCAGLHFPFLPADEFFDRDHFPWLSILEAHADTIRSELEALLAADQPAILPYVAMAPGTPANKWSPLNNKLDWGAFFLWRNGQRNDAACARCPRTAEVVESLPMADIPGRAPTVVFSLLQPGARLPPHTGVTNVRTVIHLPLIVPPGCGFRVGGETREWRENQAWAFDDTIEHEAWNDSNQLRAILIIDGWNPHIREEEKALIRAFYVAADANGYDKTVLDV
ncbi:aspartyl/asparaginyl beta-hydroxylase domain-containing protein [Sphingomonas sp. MMS24-J13]|uniref:aspartyl/asparaginyl beta-hydroxylase domain-containing protein n=1 Tax=Sphingomonas sp. MMS24-J13 TaxID=3238686 RepID=UPI00384B2EE7